MYTKYIEEKNKKEKEANKVDKRYLFDLDPGPFPKLKERALFSIPASAYHISASPDGTKLLVSSYRQDSITVVSSLPQTTAIVTEYATHNGTVDGFWRKTGRSWEHLYSGSYFGDGIVALRKSNYSSDLVYISPEGTAETLLTGSPTELFGAPSSVDSSRIAFVRSRDGVKELCIYDYAAKELRTVTDTDGVFASMRNLGVSNGKLYFSYNNDGALYKLASLDIAAQKLTLHNTNYSGQVFLPVEAAGNVFYRAAFAHSDALMLLPPDAPASATDIAVTLDFAVPAVQTSPPP
jgi:Tol biopolymer transport system component